jgi:hypothetical protein
VKTEAESPYIGLRPFTKSDRRYFFGRERDQRVIFSSLSASPLTVLYGPSGTGKSSVLHAGLIPMVRLHSRRTGVVYFNRWREAAFLDELKGKCIAEGKHVARKKNFNVDAALPLPELIAELQRHLSRPMLIVLDQFEEYLLTYPESESDPSFESELASAVALGESGASFLIALREDSLSRLDRFRTRIPNLLGNTLRLEALNSAGADEAIREPLRVYRERHPTTSAPTEIEAALVTAVRDQVCLVHMTQLGEAAGQGGPPVPARGDKIEAAILQLVMKTLWEEERNNASPILRLATLDRLGGAARIVETYFARVMERFSPPEWETCAAIFRFLVTPSGGKVAYQTSDLVEVAERPLADVDPVLKKLVECSVLRKIDAPERYELLHDILAPAVIGWRNRQVQRQQLAREAVERETRLAAERKSRLLRGAVVVALVFMGLAAFAITQWVRARNAAEQTKRGLAQLVAGKFEEAAVKNQSVPGKDLLFLCGPATFSKPPFAERAWTNSSL